MRREQDYYDLPAREEHRPQKTAGHAMSPLWASREERDAFYAEAIRTCCMPAAS